MKFLNFGRVLCIGAHPDDVEYGMLGTIHKHKETQFDIIMLSAGGDFDRTTGVRREAECHAIWDKVANATGQFCKPAGYVADLREDEWINFLETNGYILESYDCICTLPDNDSHFEHRIAYGMVHGLLRHKRIGIISYRTPSTLDSWIPNLFIEIDLKKKVSCLKLFKSQQAKPFFTTESMNSFHSNYQCFKKGMKHVELFRVETIYN